MGTLDKGIARPDDLLQGDDAGQGSVLHQSDDLIGHRGSDALDHLQQGDMKEDLGLGHTQDLSGLLLSPWYSLDTAAVDLREVTGVVDDKRDG